MTIQEILEAHYVTTTRENRVWCKACGHLAEERLFNGEETYLLGVAHQAEVLEKHMREREANAWESGYGEGALYAVCIRSHLDGLTEQDPKRPTNPHRKESSDGR